MLLVRPTAAAEICMGYLRGEETMVLQTPDQTTLAPRLVIEAGGTEV